MNLRTLRMQAACHVIGASMGTVCAIPALSLAQQPSAGPANLTIGSVAPEIKIQKVLQAPPGARTDWESLKGKVVVLEFWATWCGPCITAIPHLNQLVEEFSDQPVVFISITDDGMDRLENFLKTTPMKGWIGVDPSRTNWSGFDVASIPHTVVVGPDGRVSAVTSPLYVTSKVLRDVAAGRAIALPSKERRPSDLEWDDNEIEWKDGVKPISNVIIKPISTATSGGWLRPEGDHVTADGAPLAALVQLAYGTDNYHLDWRLPKSTQTYRVAAQVPKGREQQLLPLLQSALAATFSFKVHWQMQDKDVYVLRIAANEKPQISPSGSEEKPGYQSIRGKATARRQPLTRLCDFLTNELSLPVVDETGLSGVYDWELPYQPGQPNVTVQAVRERLGLELAKTRRTINVLVVEPTDTIKGH